MCNFLRHLAETAIRSVNSSHEYIHTHTRTRTCMYSSSQETLITLEPNTFIHIEPSHFPQLPGLRHFKTSTYMHFISMLSFFLEQKIHSMCNVLAVAMPLDSQ
jgi:hypothetical protein